MASHIIAWFWKDFADIKVSQTLLPTHYHTFTPLQSPEELFWESYAYKTFSNKNPLEKYTLRSRVTIQA